MINNLSDYLSSLLFLVTVGTKKTLWVNFQEICNTMKRNPEHLFQFMMAELGKCDGGVFQCV